MSVETTPHFTSADSVRLARRFYGLSAAASALPSERDQNFALITTTGEKFVLKIAMSNEKRATLELQNAALKHAAGRVLHLTLPRLIPTCRGADIVTIRSAGGQNYLMRLMSWLDGEVLFIRHDPMMMRCLPRWVRQWPSLILRCKDSLIRRCTASSIGT